MRKIALSLLCAGSLISMPVLAMHHSLAAGVGIEYELPVNKPEVFTNPTIIKLHAVCKIQTQDVSSLIHIKVLKRAGQINGKPVTTGDELDAPVHNGDLLDIIADPGAQVELTNRGLSSIKANCQLG